MPPKKDDKKGKNAPIVAAREIDPVNYVRKVTPIPVKDSSKELSLTRPCGKITRLEYLFDDWSPALLEKENWLEPIPADKLLPVRYPASLQVASSTNITSFYQLDLVDPSIVSTDAKGKKKEEKKKSTASNAKKATEEVQQLSEKTTNDAGRPLPFVYKGYDWREYPALKGFARDSVSETESEREGPFVDPLLCEAFRIVSIFAPKISLYQAHTDTYTDTPTDTETNTEQANQSESMRELEENYLWRAIYPRTHNENKPVYSPSGKYCVRLFLSQRWRRVYVDDSLPLRADGSPAIASSLARDELWPMLLAKAIYTAYTASGYSFLDEEEEEVEEGKNKQTEGEERTGDTERDTESNVVTSRSSSSGNNNSDEGVAIVSHTAATAEKEKEKERRERANRRRKRVACQFLSFALQALTGWAPHRFMQRQSLFANLKTQSAKILRSLCEMGVPFLFYDDIVRPCDAFYFEGDELEDSNDHLITENKSNSSVKDTGHDSIAGENAHYTETKEEILKGDEEGEREEEQIVLKTKRRFKAEYLERKRIRDEIIDIVHTRERKIERISNALAVSPREIFLVVRYSEASKSYNVMPILGVAVPGDKPPDHENLDSVQLLCAWERKPLRRVVPRVNDPVILGRGAVPVPEFLVPFPEASPVHCHWCSIGELIRDGACVLPIFTRSDCVSVPSQWDRRWASLSPFPPVPVPVLTDKERKEKEKKDKEKEKAKEKDKGKNNSENAVHPGLLMQEEFLAYAGTPSLTLLSLDVTQLVERARAREEFEEQERERERERDREKMTKSEKVRDAEAERERELLDADAELMMEEDREGETELQGESDRELQSMQRELAEALDEQRHALSLIEEEKSQLSPSPSLAHTNSHTLSQMNSHSSEGLFEENNVVVSNGSEPVLRESESARVLSAREAEGEIAIDNDEDPPAHTQEHTGTHTPTHFHPVRDEFTVTLLITVQGDFVREMRHIPLTQGTAPLNQPSDEIQPAAPQDVVPTNAQGDGNRPTKSLVSETVLVLEELRFDDRPPLMFVVKMSAEDALPMVCKSFTIPSQRLLSMREPEREREPFVFALRLYSQASLSISFQASVSLSVGPAESEWPRLGLSLSTEHGEAEVTVDETEQLLFRLPLLTHTQIQTQTETTEGEKEVIKEKETGSRPATSNASRRSLPRSLSAQRCLEQQALVFFHVTDIEVERALQLMLVSIEDSHPTMLTELPAITGQLVSLSSTNKPTPSDSPSPTHSSHSHSSVSMYPSLYDSLIGFVEQPARGLQIPRFPWKLLVLSRVPLAPPTKSIRERAVRQTFTGKYIANRSQTLFRDVYTVERASFPLAVKLNITLLDHFLPLPSQQKDGEENEAEPAPLASKDVQVLLRFYRKHDLHLVSEYVGGESLHVFHCDLAHFLPPEPAQPVVETAAKPADNKKAPQKGGKDKDKDAAAAAAAAASAAETVELIVECVLESETMREKLPPHFFSRYPHVFDELFVSPTLSSSLAETIPGAQTQREILTQQGSLLVEKPPEVPLLLWEVEMLSGHVVGVQHDYSKLQQAYAVKKQWEEKESGRAEKALSAANFVKERGLPSPVEKETQEESQHMSAESKGESTAAAVTLTENMLENLSLALSAEKEEMNKRFTRLLSLPKYPPMLQMVPSDPTQSLLYPLNPVHKFGSAEWVQAVQQTRDHEKQLIEEQFQLLLSRSSALNDSYRSETAERIKYLSAKMREQRAELAQVLQERERIRLDTERKNAALATLLKRGKDAKTAAANAEAAAEAERLKQEAKNAKIKKK